MLSAATEIDSTGTESVVATTDPPWRFSHLTVASAPPRRAETDPQRAATRPLSSMTKLSFTRTESAVALTCFRRKFRERGTKPGQRAPRISHRAQGFFGHGWNTDETRIEAGQGRRLSCPGSPHPNRNRNHIRNRHPLIRITMTMTIRRGRRSVGHGWNTDGTRMGAGSFLTADER